MKRYIIKNLDNDSIGELDFDLFEELFGKNWSDEFENIQKHPSDYIISQKYYNSEGYPINIDKIISILQNFKNKGATHVALDYNSDHIGYEIDALQIEELTEEEIKVLEDSEELAKKAKKLELIKELQDKIKQIEEE